MSFKNTKIANLVAATAVLCCTAVNTSHSCNVSIASVPIKKIKEAVKDLKNRIFFII